MAQRQPDLICLSQLRWSFVFQRPHHLMARFARDRRVFFVEEPVWGPDATHLLSERTRDGVMVVRPYLQVSDASVVTRHPPPGHGDDSPAVHAQLRTLLAQLIDAQDIRDFVLWYDTPLALPFTRDLEPRAIVYDRGNALSRFDGAPPALLRREAELLERADVVFTQGHSLDEAKRLQHHNVHPFPSSVDVAHFAQARGALADPADQSALPHPRLGFVGEIDERLDLELLAGLAAARPQWQVVMVGPVGNLPADALPRAPNLHPLGGKRDEDIPAYLAHWDVALMPFALNDATRSLSPTTAPAYLAAGKPVVSTSLRDVVRPYGERGLVELADTAEEFVAAVERIQQADRAAWLRRVDAFLADRAWEDTHDRMRRHLDAVTRAPVRVAMARGEPELASV